MNKIIPGYTVRLDDGTKYVMEAEPDYSHGVYLVSYTDNGSKIENIFIPSELYSCIHDMMLKAIEHATPPPMELYEYDKDNKIVRKVLDDQDIVHYNDGRGSYGRVGI